MVYYSEDESSGETIGKVLGMAFLVPYVVMLTLGALAIRKNIPEIAWGYWDVFLANIVLSLVRGRKITKWYKREK